nr:reverse transcriptase domain-containing protein [Tanacetum cinerariifolium]
ESSSAAARPAGGLRADYDIVATMDREIMRDPEREVGYGITDLWDEIVETLQGAPVSTDTELGGYMREFETRVRQNTEEIYMRLDDEQSQMTKIRELQAADRRRQTVISELLRADHGRSTAIIKLRTALQGQVLEGQNELFVNVLTSTFSSVNHYLSKTVGHETTYGMSWKTLMKMMIEKYCPRNEIRKLEMELWDLKVKGTDLASYTQRYQELALLCRRMFFEESDKIEKYIGGLPNMIHVGNKMHKTFPLPGESSHWQYKFPLPVKDVPTAKRLEIPLPRVCTAIEEMMKKLPVKDRW